MLIGTISIVYGVFATTYDSHCIYTMIQDDAGARMPYAKARRSFSSQAPTA